MLVTNYQNPAVRSVFQYGGAGGLKLWAVYWMYTMVVRPIITYAVVVWWPSLEYKMSQAKLRKFQRLTYLGVTGAMKMAPTAAIEMSSWGSLLFISR
jgi:hypothetical protein